MFSYDELDHRIRAMWAEFARKSLEAELDKWDEFTCPRCGSHYFGRDVTSDKDGKPVVLPTVRCHGDSSEGTRTCDWRGVWPSKKNPTI